LTMAQPTEQVVDSIASNDNQSQILPEKENKEDEIFNPLLNTDDNGISEMESLCMNCGETGRTRMLFTKIPYFREIIIMSFECEHCDWSNNEVQFGGTIQIQGVHQELLVTVSEDLNRQLIKSDSASIVIPEIEFEIPPNTQRGSISTIEGTLRKAIENLQADQEYRMSVNPEIAMKIQEVIGKLAMMASGFTLPFKLIVDDPAGNSFIENPFVPQKDPHLVITNYDRTPKQDLQLGLQPTKPALEAGYIDESNPSHYHVPEKSKYEGVERLIQDNNTDSVQEIMRFPSDCPNCRSNQDTLMYVTNIPYFKDIIIMALNCSECGYRSNEIRAGGSVPDLGTEMTLTVTNIQDFTRDVLKSDSAAVRIPEIDFEIEHGSLGGIYTTVEGLLKKIYESLSEGNPFFCGDSATKHHKNVTEDDTKQKFDQFMRRFNDIIEGKNLPFTIILRDPMGNSFIGTKGDMAPEDDPFLKIEEYERNEYENEIFGLNDIQVEDPEHPGEQQRGVPSSRMQPHKKELDHPHPYTQGTLNKIPETSTEEIKDDDNDDKKYEEIDFGLEFNESYKEETDDLFEPAEAFSKRKNGFVFKQGSKGLGYYQDKMFIQRK